jgi:hypothetical protein
MERKWGSDNGGSTAYKTAVIRDKDGSFGGGPDSYVLINDGVNDSIAADAGACEIKPTWNAAVCKGDVGRLNVGGGGGGRGLGGGGGRGFGGGARGPGAGPGAGPGGGQGGAAVAGGLGAGNGGPGGPGAANGGPGGGAGGRGAGRGAGAPAQPPVVLSRNGKEYNVTGTNIRAGTEIKVTTERPTVSLSLTELTKAPGSSSTCRDSPPQPRVRRRTAWMRCARPATPRTSRIRMHSGSRWSPTVTVLIAAALVVEPASRSAGKLKPCYMTKSPRRRPGAFCCVPSMLDGSKVKVLFHPIQCNSSNWLVLIGRIRDRQNSSASSKQFEN